MDWRKKLAALFSERSLASGFTLGVVVSLFIILLLTVTPSSPSSSLFPWFNNNLPFQNYSSSSSSVELGLVKDANGSLVQVQQPGIVQSNNSLATQFPNVPLEGVNGGNLTSNNVSSNGSSLSSSIIEDARLGLSNGGNRSSVGENSRNRGREGGNGSVVVENLPSWNSTMNNTDQGFSPPFLYNSTGVSVNSSIEIVPLYNNTTGVSSNSTTESVPGKENVTFPNNSSKAEQTRGINALPEKEAPVVLKDQEKSSNYILDNSTKTKDSLSQNQHCDIFDGKWVRDESDPLYPPGSCPHIDDDFNCFKNGRPDQDFLKWRWQPNQCDIPRLNATDFLQRLRGKRLLFVGDSLNRNMWESLVCILRQAVPDKTRVFEVSGKKRFKMSGYYSFRFKDYKCYVDFVRSTFLVREVVSRRSDGVEDEKLRLDIMDDTTVVYQKADIIVFNTGHWWTHEKTSKGKNYYQEGDHVYPVLKVLNAYEKALTTWARWIDANINPKKTQIVFRSYSLTHFRGGQWNSGGQCHKETEPIFNESFLSHYPSKNKALEQVLRHMKTPVIYLNISRLTDYRKDAHPSIYRKRYNSPEEQMSAERSQDCSHWCLPGVPDSWNQLLYASLLLAGTGLWRN